MNVNFFETISHYTRHSKKKSRLNMEKISSKVVESLDFPSKESGLNIKSENKKWEIIMFISILCFSSFLFIGKALNLGIIQRLVYISLSNQNRVRNLIIPPERGLIFDRKKNILVRNKPSFSIILNTNICSLNKTTPYLCKNIIDKLSESLSFDKDRVYKDIDVGRETIIIASGLSKDDILSIEANLILYPGISIDIFPQRDYLYPEVFSHLIGYVGFGDTEGPAVVGKSGIERTYNSYITGISGNKLVQVDSSGKTFELVSEQNPLPGKNVTLFVDLALQKKAYELLKREVDEGKATGGAIIAQDPKTAGVLTLVSYPTFDSNKLSSGISSVELKKLNDDMRTPFFNRVVSATYAPGSTFKLVTAAGALSENVMSKYTRIFDPGYIQIGTYIFRNWKLSGHGEVDLKRALQVSNDTYFYTIGGGYEGIKGLGIKKLFEWAKKFGYGAKTGIDLDGEVEGFMPDGQNTEWYLGDTYITSIGQGSVLATPLQVNNVTSYFANGGYLFKPRIVEGIDGVGATEVKITDEGLISSETYSTIREGMKAAVELGGTGYTFFDFPQKHSGIEVAGKTGTSEYNDSNGKKKTHAWFTVFGPYDDASIALTVFLEGGGSGADDAGPIARELMDLWFTKE